MGAARWIAGLAVAGWVGAGSGASGVVTIYRSTGIADSPYVATSVTCYNLGPGTTDIGVRFYSPAGSLACEVTKSAVAAGATVTVSSRLTGLFFDDAVCASAPALIGGTLEVVVNDASAERIRCAVRMLAPAGIPPAFALAMPVFNRSWIPLELLIFESGFEAGSTIDWSASAP